METVTLIEAYGKDLRIQNKSFDLCMNANMLGSVTLSAGKIEKAGTFLKKGYQLYTEGGFSEQLPYCHLLYNLGNYYMAVKDHSKALEMYNEAVRTSPFLQCGSFQGDTATKLSFNSRSCFAHTLSNLAVIYLLMSTGKASL